MGTKTDREFSYDLIRVLAMIFVIGVHLPLEFTDNIWIFTIKSAVFLTCNGMFYMLSGKFNLSKSFETEADYVVFYKKKFINIVFPFMVWTCLLFAYDYKSLLFCMSMKQIVNAFGETVFVTNPSTHIWFMYPLIGFLISAPFLSKLISSLTEKEIRILFSVGMIWELITVILINGIINVSNPFSGWFLENFMFCFVLGGIYKRIVNNGKKLKRYITIGLVALVLTILWVVLLPNRSSRAYDLSPAYALTTMGFFLFIENKANFSNLIISKIISFAARHSYGIYFIHQLVINWVEYHLRMFSGVRGYLLKYIVVIGISLLCAVVVDLIFINPIKTLLSRLMKI